MKNEKIQRFKAYQNADFEVEEKLVCLDTDEVILHGDCYHDGITELIEGFFYGLDYAKIKYIREEDERVNEIEFMGLGETE